MASFIVSFENDEDELETKTIEADDAQHAADLLRESEGEFVNIVDVEEEF